MYLASRYGEDGWTPRDPYEQYLVNRWLFVDANDLHNVVGFRVIISPSAFRSTWMPRAHEESVHSP
jgi:glutathione S-transferase